mmetsp:Transcript_3428/g.7130  ORF Transcript_3428/g.7130 Transcript_3428/m.7130 type:complete len:118 (-) Transcript_3428:31-384(-)
MTAGFSTATDWLSNISGLNAEQQIFNFKKDEPNDPILRDLRDMQDAERRAGVHSITPPKHDGRGAGLNRGAAIGARAQNVAQQQPKPKFVAHKDPTRGKKRKEKVKSNRLGNHLHMA